jgi:hypothetical protein
LVLSLLYSFGATTFKIMTLDRMTFCSTSIWLFIYNYKDEYINSKDYFSDFLLSPDLSFFKNSLNTFHLCQKCCLSMHKFKGFAVLSSKELILDFVVSLRNVKTLSLSRIWARERLDLMYSFFSKGPNVIKLFKKNVSNKVVFLPGKPFTSNLGQML